MEYYIINQNTKNLVENSIKDTEENRIDHSKTSGIIV